MLLEIDTGDPSCKPRLLVREKTAAIAAFS